MGYYVRVKEQFPIYLHLIDSPRSLLLGIIDSLLIFLCSLTPKYFGDLVRLIQNCIYDFRF